MSAKQLWLFVAVNMLVGCAPVEQGVEYALTEAADSNRREGEPSTAFVSGSILKFEAWESFTTDNGSGLRLILDMELHDYAGPGTYRIWAGGDGGSAAIPEESVTWYSTLPTSEGSDLQKDAELGCDVEVTQGPDLLAENEFVEGSFSCKLRGSYSTSDSLTYRYVELTDGLFSMIIGDSTVSSD